ncbi:MAPEG family protein [Nevskia sp.]|uniref:MAPEG family protein n=1 Tax=Nevskia sp. TaxID=1929292 RepID=UPI0025FEEC57|nr:MAPEG family protein [Nevskia sp.]
MHHATYALLLFAGWTFLLVLAVFTWRGIALLTGTKITSWPRGTKNPNDPGIVLRIADAHANCLENLPIFAVLVLSAEALGQAATVTDPIAKYVLWARLAQSTVHIIGVNTPLVLARATFWAIQLVCFGIMFAGLVL